MPVFPEEPLDTGEYLAVSSGTHLGQGRYKIVRKLGWGLRASVWLAIDLRESETQTAYYLAMKILTTTSTRMTGNRELCLLEHVKLAYYGLPLLCDNFTEINPITGGAHLCLVNRRIMTNVETLRLSAPGGRLTSRIVQSIMSRAVEALAELHSRDIILGGMTTQDLAFVVPSTTAALDPVLATMPLMDDKSITTKSTCFEITRSQAIPHSHDWDETQCEVLTQYTIYINSLGSAQSFGDDASWEGTGRQDRSMRPPEAILNVFFFATVDIWTLGCTAFLLLTGKPLFDESLDDRAHLLRMSQLAGQGFYIEFLEASERYEEFKGLLPLEEESTDIPCGTANLEKELGSATSLSEQEVKEAAEFIQLCLQLDPSERPTCSDLSNHPWLKIGRTCPCGWCSDDDY